VRLVIEEVDHPSVSREMRMSYCPGMSRPLERRTFWLLALFGVAVRVALIATTYGTNDAGFMAVWVDLVKRVGISRSYAYTAMMNHPPFSLAYLLFIDTIAHALGIAFVDVFRFFQVLADVVAATALFQIGRRTSVEHGRALALFLLLSPGAAFISGFHCNSDATMMALVCVAAATMSGTALALATGIKIVPFLFAPIFAMLLPARNAIRFAAAFIITAIVIFVPPIVIGGPIVARVVFGYRGGLPYEWGIPGVAFALSRLVPALHAAGQHVMLLWRTGGRWFAYGGIAAVWLLVFRAKKSRAEASVPTETILHAIEIMILTVLVLAPGFGVQYIGWLIVFLPFAFSWRGAIAMNAAISLFLFVTYTVWSGGWPWWFADISRAGPHRWVAAVAGYVMWAIVCGALVVSIRRFTAATRSETAD
jgi:hypothetical protein